MTMDDYIGSVLKSMPAATPNRSQIAMELRGHISERLAHGQSLDDVVRQLGDPVRLAESYLSAVPLVPARFGQRALAKIVDIVAAVVLVTPIAWLGSVLLTLRFSADASFPFVIFALAVGGSFVFAAGTVLAEYAAGQTPGKRLVGIRVVRESGARISFGQAVVRQLPMFTQVYWIDVMFALFTENNQRAFELLSKTRTVLDEPSPATA
jgi:uncharacterized RDD family membrane protein YckC